MFEVVDIDGDMVTVRALGDERGPYVGGFAVRATHRANGECAVVHLTEREAIDLALFILHGGSRA